MLRDIDVAKYFINKDSTKTLFNMKITTREGRTFYEGNARLNKFLHLAQNIYLAKVGQLLMDTSFYAYDNGAVIPNVQENYSVLLSRAPYEISFSDDIMNFLDRFFEAFKNADLEDLIELSHEDYEWEQKHLYYDKESQKMDSLKHIEEYKKQYKDIIKVMDRMVL